MALLWAFHCVLKIEVKYDAIRAHYFCLPLLAGFDLPYLPVIHGRLLGKCAGVAGVVGVACVVGTAYVAQR